MTYRCEELELPIRLLGPTDVAVRKWDLRDVLFFGHGTTYGRALFHALEIGNGQTTELFLNKCREALQASGA